MTVEDIYIEAVEQGTNSIILLIEYLTLERKVISLDDDIEKLNYFTQEKFRAKMLQYLAEYEAKKNESKRAM